MSVVVVETRQGISVTETQTVTRAAGSGGNITHVDFTLSFSSGGQTVSIEESRQLATPIAGSSTEAQILTAVLSAAEYGASRLSGVRTATAKELVDKIGAVAANIVYYP